MMATIEELTGQQWNSSDQSAGTRKYWIDGCADAPTAAAFAKAYAPAIWNGLARKSIDVAEQADFLWEATVNYSTRPPAEAGDPPSFSFEIGVAETKLFNSFGTVNYPGTIDHQGAINVKKEGGTLTTEGVDVKIPTFTWEETHYLNPAVVTSYAWLTTAEAMTAKVNNAAWRIWGPRELIFLGVSGQSKGGDVMPVTFKFASSRTRNGIVIGGLGPVSKPGWDYLWVEYEPTSNGTALTNKPKAVHVEQVYEAANFGTLSLSSPWS